MFVTITFVLENFPFSYAIYSSLEHGNDIISISRSVDNALEIKKVIDTSIITLNVCLYKLFAGRIQDTVVWRDVEFPLDQDKLEQLYKNKKEGQPNIYRVKNYRISFVWNGNQEEEEEKQQKKRKTQEE